MKIERFDGIEAWQPVESHSTQSSWPRALKVERMARKLTRKVYRLTKKTRFAIDYGLERQIQDAAGSSWLYQLPEEIGRAKDFNNRELLNREPNNLCS
ncbi:hypothetical protein ACFL4N_06545 [Thermodesulfobacteriota bacterium]